MKSPTRMHYRYRNDTVEITTPRKREKLFFPGSLGARHVPQGIEVTPIIGGGRLRYTVDEWGIKHW